MKKFYAILTICALTLSIGVTALAQGKMGAKGSKRDACCNTGKEDATPEQLRKFKADTIDLRQEMMTKRFDLQRENLKETPDNARIDALKGEIAAVKARIETIRESSKLPQSVCRKVCQMMDEGDNHCHMNCKDCSQDKTCDSCSKHQDCSCPDCVARDCKNCPKNNGCKDCSCCGKNSNRGKAGKAVCRKCNTMK